MLQILHIRQFRFGAEAGQTLAEYSLILALVAMACIIGIVAMSGSTGELYNVAKKAADAMANAIA